MKRHASPLNSFNGSSPSFPPHCNNVTSLTIHTDNLQSLLPPGGVWPAKVLHVPESPLSESDSESISPEDMSPCTSNSLSVPSPPRAPSSFTSGMHTHWSVADLVAAAGNHSPSPTTAVVNLTNHNDVSSEEDTTCCICGGIVTGYHYGIESCESCKGFFRRTVQKQRKFTCSYNNDCDISLATRRSCPACRFDKCVQQGMQVSAVRKDRSRGGRCPYSDKRRKKSTKSNVLNLSSLVPTVQYPARSALLMDIVEATQRSMLQCTSAASSGNETTSIFHPGVIEVVKWARNIKPFIAMSTEGQLQCLDANWANIALMDIIHNSLKSYPNCLDSPSASSPSTDHDESTTHVINQMGHVIVGSHASSAGFWPEFNAIAGVINKLRNSDFSVNLDHVEFAVMKALLLLSTGLTSEFLSESDLSILTDAQAILLSDLEQHCDSQSRSASQAAAAAAANEFNYNSTNYNNSPNSPDSTSCFFRGDNGCNRFSSLCLNMIEIERIVFEFLGESGFTHVLRPMPGYETLSLLYRHFRFL